MGRGQAKVVGHGEGGNKRGRAWEAASNRGVGHGEGGNNRGVGHREGGNNRG